MCGVEYIRITEERRGDAIVFSSSALEVRVCLSKTE